VGRGRERGDEYKGEKLMEKRSIWRSGKYKTISEENFSKRGRINRELERK